MKNLLRKRVTGEPLTFDEARSLCTFLLSPQASEGEKAAWLTIYGAFIPTHVELLAFREVLLERAKRVSLADGIDMCGVGGDGKDTFNISTCAALVLAAGNVPVVKHGNVGFSSSVGSSDVLTALGISFSDDEKSLNRMLEKASCCFLHAPLFHPALKELAPLRKQLGVRSIFNLLGPLLNPAGVSRQVVGLPQREIFSLYSQAAATLPQPRLLLLYSLDGYDEVSLTGPTACWTKEQGEVELQPELFTTIRTRPEDLKGRDSASESAELLTTILSGGGTEAQNEVVAANAAIGFLHYGRVPTLSEGVKLAKDILRSTEGLKVIETLRRV